MAFKMKNPALMKSAKSGSPMQMNYSGVKMKSPVKMKKEAPVEMSKKSPAMKITGGMGPGTPIGGMPGKTAEKKLLLKQ